MKTIKILTLANIKLHKHLIVLGFIGLFLYWGYLSYFLGFNSNDDVGNPLQLSSFLIQSGMLFFMLLGFQLAKKGINGGSLYQIIQVKIIKIYIFNFTFLLLLGLLFIFAIFCFNYIYYLTMDPLNLFRIESFLFLINYWLLPFYITGLIGYIFGMISSNKMVFVKLLFIWMIFPPTNLYFFGNLLFNTRLEGGMEWFNNLNLGVFNLNETYHPFYGFEFEWSKKLGILAALIIIFILTCQFMIRSKKKLGVISFILVWLCIIGFSVIPYDYGRGKVYDLDSLTGDYFYYNKPQETSSKDLFDYEIRGVNVTVKNYETFNVTSKINIIHEKQSKIAMTLYRGFTINRVAIDKIGEIPFIQSGDYVIIDLPDDLKEEFNTLVVEYSGVGSVRNPALNDYLYIPSDFVWIPNNNPVPTHFLFNSEIITNSIEGYLIPYTLNYEGNKEPVFVNLEKVSKGKYEGVSSGITLISGDLVHRVYNEKDIYYPRSWFPYNETLKNYLNEFQKTLIRYNNVFKTDYKVPSKIVLLPNMNINDTLIFASATSNSEHIILQIDPVKLTQKWLIETTIPYQMDRAFSHNKGFNTSEQYANWLIYNAMLGEYISGAQSKKEGKEINKLKEFQILLAVMYLDEDEKKVLNQLLQAKEISLPDELFLLWKQILLDDNEVDWQQLDMLLADNISQ